MVNHNSFPNLMSPVYVNKNEHMLANSSVICSAEITFTKTRPCKNIAIFHGSKNEIFS